MILSSLRRYGAALFFVLILTVAGTACTLSSNNATQEAAAATEPSTSASPTTADNGNSSSAAANVMDGFNQVVQETKPAVVQITNLQAAPAAIHVSDCSGRRRFGIYLRQSGTHPDQQPRG